MGSEHVAVGVAIGLSLISSAATHSRIVLVVGAVFATICLLIWAIRGLLRRPLVDREPRKPRQLDDE